MTIGTVAIIILGTAYSVWSWFVLQKICLNFNSYVWALTTIFIILCLLIWGIVSILVYWNMKLW